MQTLARMEVKAAKEGPLDSHRFYTAPDRSQERDIREGRA